MGHDFQAAADRQMMRGCPSLQADLGGSGKPTAKGGELCMRKYLVQVSIPTIYVIDAKTPKLAMDKAGKRFQKEHNTHFDPEFQWAELKGPTNKVEWVIADWGVLPM
jgi:hypothetical protein